MVKTDDEFPGKLVRSNFERVCLDPRLWIQVVFPTWPEPMLGEPIISTVHQPRKHSYISRYRLQGRRKNLYLRLDGFGNIQEARYTTRFRSHFLYLF
ncbi:hypothetical protein HanXRQr2_Chr13g0597201 [Helianthus annuus]|uniref:Uncharacterized protein n=1 Tax=Helianthus annuus TaxID=4232 RepID=A0A9K3EIK3_HELAN|nr:hypothetical protein HanXRQr2_Chr13g0597201 [Helianthus annuus]KAJ0849981.1 hypothetical protein HanPSC8_Chr13g0575231 [Helianthus annuus]